MAPFYRIDIPVKAVGISIPQTMTSEVIINRDKDLKLFELIVTPVPTGTIDLLGAILGIEGYGAHSGQMDIYVSTTGLTNLGLLVNSMLSDSSSTVPRRARLYGHFSELL